MRKKPYGTLLVMLLALCCALAWGLDASAQRPRTAPAQRPAPAPTPADIKITLRRSMGEGQNFENTQYIKGRRERTEMKMGEAFNQVSIMQCDLRRNIVINDRARIYMIQPMSNGDDASEGAAPADEQSAPQAGAPRRGGTTTITQNFTDTGERQKFFGYTARHLKTSMNIESSPDACERGNFRTETDGWYIDLDYGLDCERGQRPQRPGRPARPGCQDRVIYRGNGAGHLGLLVKGTTTMYDEKGRPTQTYTEEVVELSRAALDPALFDAPAGYREAKSQQEYAAAMMSGMMNGRAAGGEDNDADEAGARPSAAGPSGAAAGADEGAGPKRPGVIRVGVATIANHGGRPVSTEALAQRLAGGITGPNVEAVTLAATAPDALADEAKRKQCDYILYTDITGMKQSKAGKVGGMFGRAAGIGSMGADKTEVKIDYRLVPMGAGTPFQSSATAKEEGDEASVGAALEHEAQAVVAAINKK